MIEYFLGLFHIYLKTCNVYNVESSGTVEIHPEFLNNV